MKLLGIVGSLRPASYNAELMRAAQSLLPDGAGLTVFDGLRDIPPFDEQDREADSSPAAVEAFTNAIAEADGVLFATPEYNGSIPGQLKNALDWASVPFAHNVLRNKPVAVIGTSTGMFGAVWAQADLRRILGLIGARAIDRDTPVPFAETAFPLEPEMTEAVAATLTDLVALVDSRVTV